jgi:hypothetical protein
LHRKAGHTKLDTDFAQRNPTDTHPAVPPVGFLLGREADCTVIGVRRVTVYIDGFNLYYALLKPNPAVRWLDLAALGAALRPGDTVSVRYFTAKVL